MDTPGQSLILDGPLIDKDRLLRFPVEDREMKFWAFQCEIVLWISLAKRNPQQGINWSGSAPPVIFPALLDTGCSESLVVHEWHLDNWCKLRLDDEEIHAAGRERYLHSVPCPIANLDVWLHQSKSGAPETPPTAKDPAVKMKVSGGVMVSVVQTSRVFKKSNPADAANRPKRTPARGRSGQRAEELAAEESYFDLVQSGRGIRKHTDDIPPRVHPRLPLVGIKSIHTNHWLFSIDGTAGTFSLRTA